MSVKTKAEDLIPVAMQIILHAGNARNLADDAFKAAKSNDFKLSSEKMKAAHDEIVLAHNSQTSVIQAEASGEKYEYSPLFAHAQDTLMTISTEMNSTEKLIEILAIYYKER